MSVASKNLYSLLSEDGEPIAVSPAAGKAAGAAKVEQGRTTQTTGRRGYSGNEAAFRDRQAGASRNRDRTTDDGTRGAPRGGYGARVRGGRGARHPRDRDDRHPRNIAPGSEKQAAQSWGATEGEAELKDEVAGQEMAKDEKKAEGEAEAKEVAEPEPEDKSISYADYLAQQAEKKLALDNDLQVRQANEGSKVDKKWANAKALVKDEDDDFIAGSGGKTKRERERKVKQVLDIDQRYVEPAERTRGGARGGRGGPRGGSGAPRGGRGDSGAPRGAPRGGPRGGAGAGGRGRGDKNASAPINTSDQQMFPSLGK